MWLFRNAMEYGSDPTPSKIYWRGQHPQMRFAEYTFAFRRAGTELNIDNTHCLVITVAIVGTNKMRLLWQHYDNFECPGMDPDQVALRTTSRLTRWLLACKNPSSIPGAFDLLYRRDSFRCPWTSVYSEFRRLLFQSQLKSLSITYDQYLKDRETYNSLRPANFTD